MPNSNYIRGRKKEYRVMNDERKLGNLVLRSAGSHSPIDVVSIDVSSRVIKLIQCKPDDISKLDRDRLELQARELNNVFRCEFVLC
jgi:hypothetical protein